MCERGGKMRGDQVEREGVVRVDGRRKTNEESERA